MRLTISGIFFAIIGLFALLAFFGAFYTIDAGERGVLLRNGAVTGVANPGMNFKVPFIDSVVEVSVQDRKVTYDPLAAYSRDQQSANMAVSVNYRILPDRVTEVYTRFGGEQGLVDKLISPKVNEHLKTVFGTFNAETAIRERGRLNQEALSVIAKAITGPVVIEGVQIENIDFSDAYELSVEQRMLAEVEVAKLRQNAEREKVQAQIVVTQASAQADARRAAADAEAYQIREMGNAEAEAIKARGDALRENPNLIGLVTAEKWDGTLPTTMLPGGSVPMLSLR